MIFNMSGGGGAALNFKVMGGTAEPSNHAENTIWIDTDAKITGWLFSSHQPENPAEGMVWIATGSASNAEINALKKNVIMVYPLSAKHYINGAWVDKTVKSYQGGEWVDLWNGSLYDSGNEYTEITGGWVAEGKAMGNWEGARGVGTPVLTKHSDNMVFSVSSNGNGAMFYTKNKINLANYTTLHLECTLNTPNAVGYEHWHNLNIWTSIGDYYTSNRAATTDLHGTGDATRTIDVSNLNSSYYIGFSAFTKETVTVKKLWLE